MIQHARCLLPHSGGATTLLAFALMRQSVRADRFLRACVREPTDVTPIWMMRQAGRALPAYRALRVRHSFLDLIREPELIADVTLMPLREFDVDAAILFADITLPLWTLSVGFDLLDDVGPVIAEPIRTRAQVEAMTAIPIPESTPTVLEAITMVRKELDGAVPLIGFSGAPFTLASYLVEGKSSRDYSHTKALMYGDAHAWDGLMTRLTDLVIEYIHEQVAAGVQAVQLFDSWIGALAPSDVERYVLPYTKRIFEATSTLGVPRIHFGTGTAGFVELMAAPACDVVGVDWRINLDDAWRRVGPDRAIQGNLDPAVLLGPPALVVSRARDVLARAAGRPGHIFNLGHGVPPGAGLDNLKLLVDTVHEYRP